MTTILGIKTNSGPDAVVLVADRQESIPDGESQYSLKGVKEKIHKGKNWAMAYMGAIDPKIDSFYKLLSEENARYTLFSFMKSLNEGKTLPTFYPLDPRRIIQDKVRSRAREIRETRLEKLENVGDLEKLFGLYTLKEYTPTTDFEREAFDFMSALSDPIIHPVEIALKRKLFFEVILLNAYSRSEDVDGSNEFLLATNVSLKEKHKVELYEVDCFGKLIPVQSREDGLEFLCGGTGASFVTSFFESDFQKIEFNGRPIDPEEISIQEAMFLVDIAMKKKAPNDMYTGETYSMIIVTEDKIDEIDIVSEDERSHAENLAKKMQKYQETK